MARTDVAMLSFNKGIVSSLALARTDLGNRIASSADIQTNWMPRALGAMMLRAGMGYIGNTRLNKITRSIAFVFSLKDTARIELSDNSVCVWIDDIALTRPGVASVISNPNFTTDLSGWTDADELGAASIWGGAGLMFLTGSGGNRAIRYQLVTNASTGIEHSVNVVILQGSVTLKIGSTIDSEDIRAATVLTTGVYSLAFTPNVNFYVQLSALEEYTSQVGACSIEAAGLVVLPSIWAEADLPNIRSTTSGDVIFAACQDKKPQRITRYGQRSWAVTDDEFKDGPMRLINETPITISSSDISGNVSLTASGNVFDPGHVGALFSLTSSVQIVRDTLNGSNQFVNPIIVTGILEGRTFQIDVTGTWVGTLTLEQSVGVPGSWTDVKTYTTNVTAEQYLDNADNAVIYYRIGFKVSAYTSGSAIATLTFRGGAITGTVQITAVSGPAAADAIVFTSLGDTQATADWYEGAWSDFRGYPGAIAIHEGRKWLAGKDNIWSTVAGSFSSFDATVTGDSGPISKSIGFGPIDTINWLVSGQVLLVGAELSEITVRSSSIDDPLTPSASSLKSSSTQGSAPIASVNIDGNVIFVQRCGIRLYVMQYAGAYAVNAYGLEDLTVLSTEIAGDGFVSMCVQRQPDTRIHCVRSDGQVAVLIFDKIENVNCWVLVQTDGIVEDVCVLPGIKEDVVYYQVKRTINGSDVRFYEKWALEEECQGGLLNKQADAFVIYDGVPITVVAGAGHLEGEDVVVWADGLDVGTHTVTGGQFTLAVAASKVVYGKGYTAQYKSTKLAYASQTGTALCKPKKVSSVGVIMKNTHASGVKYGRDFDHLDSLPRKVGGVAVDPNYIHPTYDEVLVSANGSWDTDSRWCLQAQAPRPCTMLATIIGIEESDS